MKVMELEADVHNESFARLVKDFFNPDESWGRQNRNQLLVGLTCAGIYFATNLFFSSYHPQWNPFLNSSNGLITAVFLCIILTIANLMKNSLSVSVSEIPWYEKYMPMIITLLGLITLAAFQNLDGKGADDASLWINIVILLIVFIIASGYFVEGKSNEKIIKIWFALFGYYLSVLAFFYATETFLF